jgi:ubiquinone/menaquinone biosynthesis C-methylase UbiE
MSIDFYNEKAKLYDKFRNPSAGWEICKKFLNIQNTDTILDLGCGSGTFLFKILESSPKILHGLDVSIDMLNQAKEKLDKIDYKNTYVDLFNFSIENLESNKYDKILCCQVVQNLTYDKENILEMRYNFYKQIMRVLKPGGKLIITTRYYNARDGYDSMYWYADKNHVPKSLYDMEKFVPSNLEGELNKEGFINIVSDISSDLIYKSEFYKDINYFDNVSWQAADSFWSHIKRNNELINLDKFLKDKREKGELEDYIKERDIKRNNHGHILIVSCTKNT